MKPMTQSYCNTILYNMFVPSFARRQYNNGSVMTMKFGLLLFPAR